MSDHFCGTCRFSRYKMGSVVLACVIALAGAGCGGSGGNGGNGDNDDDSQADNGTEPDAELFAELEGTWERVCHDLDGESAFHQDSLVTYDNGTAEIDFRFYEDESCNEPVGEARIVYDVALGETIVTESGLEAREIDMEVVEDPDEVAAAEQEFNIYHIEEGDQDTKYRGQSDPDDPPATAGQRPNTLDFEVPAFRVD